MAFRLKEVRFRKHRSYRINGRILFAGETASDVQQVHVEAQLVAQLEEGVRSCDCSSIGHRLAAARTHVEAHADNVQAEGTRQLHQCWRLRHAVAAKLDTQRALADAGITPDTNEHPANTKSHLYKQGKNRTVFEPKMVKNASFHQ